MKSGMVTRARDFLHRHWRRALRWREKLVLREEAFHLVLAGLVGVIGGLVNLFFFYAVHLIQPGDPVEVVGRLNDWERILVPTLGGLAAGLVLHWGLRFVGPQGSTNLLEVVVAGDGRLPFRTELVKTVSAIISIARNWRRRCRRSSARSRNGRRTGCGCWLAAARRPASRRLTTRRLQAPCSHR
jgi:hypothetical protein